MILIVETHNYNAAGKKAVEWRFIWIIKQEETWKWCIFLMMGFLKSRKRQEY